MQSHVYGIVTETERVKNQIIEEMEKEINTNFSKYKNQNVKDLNRLTSIQNDKSHLGLNSNPQKYLQRFSGIEFVTNVYYRYRLDIVIAPPTLSCKNKRITRQIFSL